LKNCFKTSCFFCEKSDTKKAQLNQNINDINFCNNTKAVIESSKQKINYTKYIKLRQKEKQKTKIIALFAVLIVLIMLIPIQTLLWLKNNKQEEPKWFSQTENVRIRFKTG
jgi:hypothetical protein